MFGDCISEPNEFVCECYILVSSHGGSRKRERQRHLTMPHRSFCFTAYFWRSFPVLLLYKQTDRQQGTEWKLDFCL